MSKINKIYVHGGIFHADDAMCVALMKYLNKDISVQRVFKAPETIGDNEIIADIGGGRYDHHQKDAELRPDGSKYAACGLIFRDFADKIFTTQKGIDAFERKYIIPIELQDNGVEQNPLSAMISSFVPSWNSDESMDTAFNKAVDLLYSLIENEVKRDSSVLEADEITSKALEESNGQDYVILPQFCPWQNVLISSEAKYVIFPALRGGWNIQCIPSEPGSFVNKQKLPEGWLNNQPKGCTFVHPACFLASFSSKEDAIEAIRSL